MFGGYLICLFFFHKIKIYYVFLERFYFRCEMSKPYLRRHCWFGPVPGTRTSAPAARWSHRSRYAPHTGPRDGLARRPLQLSAQAAGTSWLCVRSAGMGGTSVFWETRIYPPSGCRRSPGPLLGSCGTPAVSSGRHSPWRWFWEILLEWPARSLKIENIFLHFCFWYRYLIRCLII